MKNTLHHSARFARFVACPPDWVCGLSLCPDNITMKNTEHHSARFARFVACPPDWVCGLSLCLANIVMRNTEHHSARFARFVACPPDWVCGSLSLPAHPAPLPSVAPRPCLRFAFVARVSCLREILHGAGAQASHCLREATAPECLPSGSRLWLSCLRVQKISDCNGQGDTLFAAGAMFKAVRQALVQCRPNRVLLSSWEH